MHKEVKDVIEEYSSLGCKFVEGKNHIKVYAPDGRFLRVIGRGSHNPGWELIRRMKSEINRIRGSRP